MTVNIPYQSVKSARETVGLLALNMEIRLLSGLHTVKHPPGTFVIMSRNLCADMGILTSEIRIQEVILCQL